MTAMASRGSSADAIEVFMRDFGGFGGFGEVFGQRGRSSQAGPPRGESLRTTLSLTLSDVAHGGTHTIPLALLETCQTCDGVGTVIADPCPRCHGEGRVRANRELEVEVPPGVTSENYITLRGRGHVGPRGGARGDVVVLLDVQEDPRFIRDGSSLIHERPITFSEAALGAEVTVPTLDGSATVRVPPGVQSGALLRIRAQGLPPLNGERRGDLLVRVVVWTPEHLTADQEELFRKLRDVEDEAPERVARSDDKGFWSRVKEAFTGS